MAWPVISMRQNEACVTPELRPKFTFPAFCQSACAKIPKSENEISFIFLNRWGLCRLSWLSLPCFDPLRLAMYASSVSLSIANSSCCNFGYFMATPRLSYDWQMYLRLDPFHDPNILHWRIQPLADPSNNWAANRPVFSRWHYGTVPGAPRSGSWSINDYYFALMRDRRVDI